MNNSQQTVRLTRRVSFSSGHRFWLDHLSEADNRALFGQYASRYNHGHNYVLEVSVEGKVSSEDGMVLNIKDLDALLKTRVTTLFDGKSINDEIPPFQNAPPSLENLSLCIWNLISGEPLKLPNQYSNSWRWDADLLQGSEPTLDLPPYVRVSAIRLEEMPGLYVELESLLDRNLMTFTRTYEFAASHRLHLKSLSDAENVELFGKCNNRAGHGHNYVLEVTVEGVPDSQTGMLVDLDTLDKRVNSRVIDRFDHKNLNEDIPELQGLNPTSELVAMKIFDLLNHHLPTKLHRIRLHETARNCFEVTSEPHRP